MQRLNVSRLRSNFRALFEKNFGWLEKFIYDNHTLPWMSERIVPKMPDEEGLLNWKTEMRGYLLALVSSIQKQFYTCALFDIHMFIVTMLRSGITVIHFYSSKCTYVFTMPTRSKCCSTFQEHFVLVYGIALATSVGVFHIHCWMLNAGKRPSNRFLNVWTISCWHCDVVVYRFL